jgi:hypothetical protein
VTPAAVRAMIAEGRELVPDHLWPGLERYFVKRVRPGQFLVALLSNDLREAVGRADPVSFAALPDLLRFLCTFAPRGSHGHARAVDQWLIRVEVTS